MNELLSIKGLLVIFIVAAGIIGMFIGDKEISLMCIGGALAFINPKQNNDVKE